MSEAPVIPDPRPTYERAAEQMLRLVTAVRPEQLGRPTPCTEYDVRELLGHVVAGADRLANVGEGKSPEGPEVPPWTHELPDDGWPQRYEAARARLIAAWADDAKLDEMVTVPWGHVPGRAAVAGAVMETAAHTWDLARAIGWRGELDAGVAELALATARQALPPAGREGIPFGEAWQAPEGADAYTRLAAYLGRAPEWKEDK